MTRRIIRGRANAAIVEQPKRDVVEIPRIVSVREVGAGIAVEVLEQSGKRFARIVGARGGSIRPIVVVEASAIDPLIASLGAVATEIGGAR